MSAVKSKVVDTDKGMRALFRRLARAKNPIRLTVGIHEDQGGSEVDGTSGLTLSELGEIHEYGLGVPRRSFIADWADETIEQKKTDIRKIALSVVKGTIGTIEQGFARLGNLYVAQIQKRIADNTLGESPYQPLAQSTIDRKGSSVALVDTGQLKSAITFEVKS